MTGARIYLTHDTEEATASGIYGIIVGASVLVGAHGRTAWADVITVLVALIVYWAAERYARIVAKRIHGAHRPAWHVVREQLTSGWEMVTASLLPLVVLVVVRLTGTRLLTAEILSLCVSTLLLGLSGWRMGSGGRLSAGERIVCTLVAGAFGAVLIVLKTLLH